MKTLLLLTSFAIARVAFGQVAVNPFSLFHSDYTASQGVGAHENDARFYGVFYLTISATDADVVFSNSDGANPSISAASFSMFDGSSWQSLSGFSNYVSNDRPQDVFDFSSNVLRIEKNAQVMVPIDVIFYVGNGVNPSNLSLRLDSISWISSAFIGAPDINMTTYFQGAEWQIGAQSAIPEPSTYAAIAGIVMIGFVAWKRRKALPTSSVSSAS